MRRLCTWLAVVIMVSRSAACMARPGASAGSGSRARSRSGPGLVGPESDRLDLRMPTPRPIEVLSNVSFSCGGRWTWSNAAYYTVRSGAGVISTGTMRWVPALGHTHRVSPAAWHFVQEVTTTVLRAFATGPCGRTYPPTTTLRLMRLPGTDAARWAPGTAA
jgi:hypothetical protein